MAQKHYNWSKKRITAKEESDKKNKLAEAKAKLETEKAMKEAAKKRAAAKSPLQKAADEAKLEAVKKAAATVLKP